MHNILLEIRGEKKIADNAHNLASCKDRQTLCTMCADKYVEKINK